MQIGQIAVNSLVWAAELGVIAIGMSLAYRILGFANFAHGEFVTIGAYATYALHIQAGLPLWNAIPAAMLVTGLFAVLLDLSVFSQVRQASAVAKMVLSVGIATIIRAVIAVLFGTSAVHLEYPARRFEMGNVSFTDLQIIIIVATLVSMIIFHLVFQQTKLGKALRATADNPALAEAKGINTAGVIRWMWFVSGVFAALGGILLGLETQLRPALGSFVLMPMFAAVTVGGLGSVYGAVAGALVLAIAQNLALSIDFGSLLGLASWRLSAGYKTGIALLALVATLLIRPQGLFGKEGQ